jgi:16S rRNA (cytidine1402-2'-O)-methyltransferase
LTKLHEECRRTTLSEAADYYAETPPRGEFVLVVQGLPPAPAQPEVELDAALAMARALLDKGVSTRDAARSVASRTGHPRRAVYEGLLAAREAMYRESL